MILKKWVSHLSLKLIKLYQVYHWFAVFHPAISNMAHHHVAFCECHVALHERHVAFYKHHFVLRERHVALLIFVQ